MHLCFNTSNKMGKKMVVFDIDERETLVNETTRYDINALMKNGCELGDH